MGSMVLDCKLSITAQAWHGPGMAQDHRRRGTAMAQAPHRHGTAMAQAIYRDKRLRLEANASGYGMLRNTRG